VAIALRLDIREGLAFRVVNPITFLVRRDESPRFVALAPAMRAFHELVVVIGKAGRHISQECAFDHVAGYTCMNEGTVRDWMGKGTQNLPAKNFDRSGGLGPFIVAADEVPDPTRLRIITRRNGRVVQDGSTEQMIFDIPFLIAHISKFTRLEPGDGEVIEVEISGIGRLENPNASE